MVLEPKVKDSAWESYWNAKPNHVNMRYKKKKKIVIVGFQFLYFEKFENTIRLLRQFLYFEIKTARNRFNLFRHVHCCHLNLILLICFS